MILADLPSALHTYVLQIQKQLHINQFLMNLSPEFEPVRAALMNQDPSSDIESCVQDVVHEELRLILQQALINDLRAFLAPSAIVPASETTVVATHAPKLQCCECKGYIHVAKLCKKKKLLQM